MALVVLPLVDPSPGVAAQGQESSGQPAVFTKLEGVWEGTGTLLGRPAEFSMRWAASSAGFVRLTFANAWVGEDGSRTPVLSSEAVYYVDGSSVIGVWVDDRPQRLTMEAIVTDSSVVTDWTAEAEKGRTEYHVRSPDSVVVRDFVYVEGAERLFGEATYRRRTSEPGG